MFAFLQMLQEKYGGVRQYLKQYLDLSDVDIDVIRRNIITNGSPHL